MKKTTWTLAAIGAAGLLTFSGCDSTAGAVIKGKAIDPYLAGATVCLADSDRVCFADEATVTTDENGSYTLRISGAHLGEEHTIVVRGGTDTETNSSFKGTIAAWCEANASRVNVSPLTTWLLAEYREHNVTDPDARHRHSEKLRKHFGIDFDADIVAQAHEGNTTGLKVALALARSAELYDVNDTFGFYVHVAHHHDAHTPQDCIREAASEAESELGGTGLRDGVDSIIDAIEAAHDDVHSIAREAHKTAHEAAEEVHGFVHNQICKHTRTCRED
jgi:hypothetical protein